MIDEPDIAAPPPPMMTSLVDLDTMAFLTAGQTDGKRFVRVDVPDNPDPVRQKFSGDTKNPIADRSEKEIAEALTSAAVAARMRDAEEAFAAVRWAVLVAEAGRLGTPTLTPDETADVHKRFLVLYLEGV